MTCSLQSNLQRCSWTSALKLLLLASHPTREFVSVRNSTWATYRIAISLACYRASTVSCSNPVKTLVLAVQPIYNHFSPSFNGWAYSSQTFNNCYLKKLQHLSNLWNKRKALGRLTCVLSALPTGPWSNRPRNRLPHPPCTQKTRRRTQALLNPFQEPQVNCLDVQHFWAHRSVECCPSFGPC